MALFARKHKQLSDQPSGRHLEEVGVAGNVVFSGFDGEEKRADSVSIQTYRDMLDKDTTVEALFNVFTLPIIATNYKINADEDDLNEEQAEFVRKCLFEPPYKGGMETPFSLFLDQLLLAAVDGFQLFERVYRLDDKSKYTLKKLAHRDSIGLTLKRDDHGGYNGVRQQVTYDGQYIDVVIPAYKTFLFTHNKARSFLYGRSMLTSLYPKYEKKRRLEYLDSIGLQSDAIKPKVLEKTNNSMVKDDSGEKSPVRKALAMLSKLGELKSAIALPFGYKVTALNTEGRSPHESIERQNSEMARAFLATVVLMGSQGKESNVGSYALSSNLSNMLMISIQSFMNKIEEHINQYLIAELIDLNFAQRHYPEFKFDDVTSETAQAISDAFGKLIEKDRISDEMVKGIEDATANRLNIDLATIKKQREEQAKKEADGDNEGGAAGSGGKFPDQQLSEDRQWWRPLNPAEKTVNFADLNSRMNAMEQRFVDDSAPLIKPLVADMVKRAMKSKPNDFTVELPTDYRYLVMNTVRSAYDYAKKGAADELGIGSPATNKEAQDGMQQLTVFVVQKQQDDLKNLVRGELIKAARTKQLAEESATEEDQKPFSTVLETLLGSWFAEKLKQTASALVSKGVNNGRGDVLDAVAEDNDLFQYSSLLDDKVCAMCIDLDGKTVTRDVWRATKWKPPLHFHCRCIWVLIRKMVAGKIDTALPDISVLPDEAGGKSGPLL